VSGAGAVGRERVFSVGGGTPSGFRFICLPTQGSSVRAGLATIATLGWRAQSLWDCMKHNSSCCGNGNCVRSNRISHFDSALRLAALVWFVALSVGAETAPIVQQHWFEARTAHFNIYSYGPTQEVARVGGRLEQFREAYSVLAGVEAVASPPIVVIAFPTHEALEPFLPLYQGKPANLAAFFHRSSDENLIALSLTGQGAASLNSVYHEYTHLLLRHNALYWPLWLDEGMADVYSTFETTGGHGIRIGKPQELYGRLLAKQPLMPLRELFAVTNGSPEYNERDRQGIFYAESWLLTHYLMMGDNAVLKPRFGQLTALLRQGQLPEQAFTNALRITLQGMENLLRGYLERGRFEPLNLTVNADLSAPRALGMRNISPVETCFRLGDLLMRVSRLDEAGQYFEQGQKIAPKSPLPFEGLGLLASERKNHDEAMRQLSAALEHGSISFLAHYGYAREKLRRSAESGENYSRIDGAQAGVIREELQKSLALMPNFGPAHHLLGFFLMIQGDDLSEAEKHLQRAIQLEPENQAYLFSLAQVQVRKDEPEAARRTLEPLRLPYADSRLKAHAEEMMKEIQALKR
jgi:tetratricopeptide (TPR) repeat protein